MKYESPTSVMMYLNCNHAYELRYIQHLKPEYVDDTYFRLGKSVHTILEKFYSRINISTDIESVGTHFLDIMKKVATEEWDRTIDAKKRDDINNSLYLWLQFEVQRFKNYKKSGIENRFVPIATEEDIKDHVEKLHCIVDKRCIGMNGNMYALDYKSDTRLPIQKNFSNDLDKIDLKYKVQAAINAMALKGQGVNIDNFYFQFIRYPDKLLSVPLVNELFIEVQGYINQIRSSTEFPKNKNGCYRCGLKVHCENEDKSIHCQYGGVI